MWWHEANVLFKLTRTKYKHVIYWCIYVAGLTLSSDAPASVAEIFQPVKFDFSIDEGSNGLLYQMEYGDGADK